MTRFAVGLKLGFFTDKGFLVAIDFVAALFSAFAIDINPANATAPKPAPPRARNSRRDQG